MGFHSQTFQHLSLFLSLYVHTDKPAKPKRRGDQTPEKSVTPEPSIQGVSDESNQIIGGVLSREDVESLAVNFDELQKVAILIVIPGLK